MAQVNERTEVRIGPQGRIVIPARLRKALGLRTGDKVLAHVEGERLVLERRRQIVDRLRSRYATVPSEISLADELIAQRRTEARREALE